ncbi:MAG: penicillin-insensitive murein endopeptidase [Proteobacteria bacterium]|nr:penicillin-insensitive murein endopeptidase [Pseudomonadota bacterium]
MPAKQTIPWAMAVLSLALGAGPVVAETPAESSSSMRQRWAGVKQPKQGQPRAIGSYRAGCVQGAATLPLDGTGYQVMRPSRRRYYGHPDLIDFIKTLANEMNRRQLGVLLVGDLGQPRGGPAPSGHASHQSGLDVDLWYTYPEQAARRSLSRDERENTAAGTLVDVTSKKLTAEFTPRIVQILKITASDRRVERVFVNPVIKSAICASESDDRDWLRKLRPWWGHHDHFHVRLACPEDSPTCIPQRPVSSDLGCERLNWWFSDASKDDRKKARGKYRKRIRTAPKMPPQCRAVLQ